MGIEGLRFVITGSATGIGAATARVAASKGAKVMVSDLSDEQGQAVAAEINASGGTAAYQHCDVTDTDQVEALMAAAAEAFGGIDVLHNNAGIHESGLAPADQCNLEQMSLDVFRKVVEVNAVAPWICSKAALPYLKESDWPSIVNAASTGAQSAYPNNSAYGTSKGGIRLQTQNLAVDLAPLGIRGQLLWPHRHRHRHGDRLREAVRRPGGVREGPHQHLAHPPLGTPLGGGRVGVLLGQPRGRLHQRRVHFDRRWLACVARHGRATGNGVTQWQTSKQ